MALDQQQTGLTPLIASGLCTKVLSPVALQGLAHHHSGVDQVNAIPLLQ
jgi:hypothetical protein